MNMKDNSSDMLVSDSIVDELESVDAVIFDCDGVIFDSNDLKIQAMEEVLHKPSHWVKALQKATTKCKSLAEQHW